MKKIVLTKEKFEEIKIELDNIVYILGVSLKNKFERAIYLMLRRANIELRKYEVIDKTNKHNKIN